MQLTSLSWEYSRSEKRKRWSGYILSHFDEIICATHQLNLGMDQGREKEGVIILSHFGKIYVTHILKLGMDQRREKEGVVIVIDKSMQLTS